MPNNSVVDGRELPAGLYIPATTKLGPASGLSMLDKVSERASEFCEEVARTNNPLVQGFKRIESEL